MDKWPPQTEKMPPLQNHKCPGLQGAGESILDSMGEGDKDWRDDNREEEFQGRG